MPQMLRRRRDPSKAAEIVRDVGGKVVGRTRFQKVAYLLEITGLGSGFPFGYRHYGPYSEALADALQNATLLGLIEEQECPTSWGGFYSVFTTREKQGDDVTEARRKLAKVAANADPVELELVATAVFLSLEGAPDPWRETATRKPNKAAQGRLEKAKTLYSTLGQIRTPIPLPDIG